MVIRGLCETLLKTGASSEIVATTMMGALRKVLSKSECEILKDTGRTLFEQGVRGESNCSIRNVISNVFKLNVSYDCFVLSLPDFKLLTVFLIVKASKRPGEKKRINKNLHDWMFCFLSHYRKNKTLREKQASTFLYCMEISLIFFVKLHSACSNFLF